MMTKQTYNGWSNYETWVVKLWIDNEQGSYEYWQEQAREAKRNDDAYGLQEALKDEHEENTPETSGVYADLLSAALSSVNWREIAEAMIGDLDDEPEEDDEK